MRLDWVHRTSGFQPLIWRIEAEPRLGGILDDDNCICIEPLNSGVRVLGSITSRTRRIGSAVGRKSTDVSESAF